MREPPTNGRLQVLQVPCDALEVDAHLAEQAPRRLAIATHRVDTLEQRSHLVHRLAQFTFFFFFGKKERETLQLVREKGNQLNVVALLPDNVEGIAAAIRARVTH